MKIIVGLGNPGNKYSKSRHNLGWMAVEKFQKDHKDSFSEFKIEKKLNAEISVGLIEKAKVILVKPQLFYNESGMVTAAVMNFYKAKVSDLIVIHDELDLPYERIKIAFDASAAGNNGVAAIINTIKTKAFIRVRVGISNSLKGKGMDGADFVLGHFAAEEKASLTQLLTRLSSLLTDLITTSTLEKVQTKYH